MGGEHPDWLPVDWKLSVKIRSSGRKDKYYIHPSTGLTLSSKPEVLRYLKNSEMSKLKKINKIGINKTVAENLPQGWIKEIRIKKSGGKTRRDPYYTDPVSGRQFRSMQEVLRYLKSKDLGEVESKSDDKGRTSMELVDRSQSSSAEAKGQRSIVKKGDKNMTDGESIKSGPDAAALKNVEKPLVEESRRKDDDVREKLQNKLSRAKGEEQRNGGRRLSKRLADNKLKHDTKDNALQSGSEITSEDNMNILPERKGPEQRENENDCMEESYKEDDSVRKKLQNKLSQAKGGEQRNGGRRLSKRLADNKLKHDSKDNALPSGSEITSEDNMNILPERKGPEQRENENDCTEESEQPEDPARQNKRINTKRKWMNNIPRRTSRRLARLEADQSVEVKTGKMNGASARLSSNGEVDSTKNAGPSGQSDEPEIDNSVKSETTGSDEQCRTENPTNNDQKKPMSSENVSPEDQEHDKHVDSSLKDLLMDPCIEFAIKTLTGAIPIEDVNKVGDNPVSSNQMSGCSSLLPSGDIWSDPCFEFAVKMLTGEMPPEDGLQLQVSFEKPVSSSTGIGSLPKNERRKV